MNGTTIPTITNSSSSINKHVNNNTNTRNNTTISVAINSIDIESQSLVVTSAPKCIPPQYACILHNPFTANIGESQPQLLHGKRGNRKNLTFAMVLLLY